MANRYPGKSCTKPVADMSSEEHRLHRVYVNAHYKDYSKRKKAGNIPLVNKYPGKRCIKKVADMTPKERRENRIYMTATCAHRRANMSQKQKDIENEKSRIRQAKPENVIRSVAYHKKRRHEYPEKCKEYDQKCVDDLKRSYVKTMLQKQLGLRFSEMPEILVQLKRAQLKLRRMANA